MRQLARQCCWNASGNPGVRVGCDITLPLHVFPLAEREGGEENRGLGVFHRSGFLNEALTQDSSLVDGRQL